VSRSAKEGSLHARDRHSRPSLILASASPRRREILSRLGIAFELVIPEVEELREGPPERLVIENARRKARTGLERATPGGVSLGVDTEVVVDGRVLGKAEDADVARRHLELLSGRSHEVFSGLVLLGEGERAGTARSQVTFRRLDERAIELYLASEEWRDRAGAYAIQGLGSLLVERIEGDLSNVIGLPVGLLLELAPELLETARPRGREGSGKT
jgi:septum formation protein